MLEGDVAFLVLIMSNGISYITDYGECDQYSPLDNSSDAQVNTTNKSNFWQIYKADVRQRTYKI